MANPTAITQVVAHRYDDNKKKLVLPQTLDTYYPGEMIGRPTP